MYPAEFRRIQAARLLDWHDTGSHPEFNQVVQAVIHVLRPSSLMEKTAESEAATLMRPPPHPAMPGKDQPCGAAPRWEAAATPSVSATAQPERHCPTTSTTPEPIQRSRRPKRWRLWGGGVLLGLLVTALYLALSGWPPPPRPELLVGTWRFTGVELGQPLDIVWHLRPDGTGLYIVNGMSQGAGTWQYMDAHIYERYPDGRQGKGAIQVLDHNHFVVTIVENGVPAQTGLRRLYVRQ
jgi:hypothetical protein